MLLKLICLLHLCSAFGSNYTVGRSCPADTFSSKFGNKWCYKFFETPETFKMAEYNCVQRGGHLAQINDLQLNKFLAVKARKELEYDVKFWIGAQSAQLQDNNYNNIWTWTDRSLITYFNWNQDQSQASGNTYGEQKCVAATIVDETWSVENCSAKMPYLCQIPSAVSLCEPGWTLNDKIDKCFKAFTHKGIVHRTSEVYCQAQGGHLASIHSEEENDFLCNLTSISYTGFWSDVGIWIGAVSDANKIWYWTDKSDFSYSKWVVEADFEQHVQLCSLLMPDAVAFRSYNTKEWDNIACYAAIHRFICQKNPIIVFP